MVSGVYGRKYLLDEGEKDFFKKLVQAHGDLLGVEMLTFCIESNHFALLLRVPHRPENLPVPFEMVLRRVKRAFEEDTVKLVYLQMALWERIGNVEAMEEWRQKVGARIFSLSEFVKCAKFRFTRWYKRKKGRQGGLWESRSTPIIVEEEERALRTMAAFINLNRSGPAWFRTRRTTVGPDMRKP